MILTHEVSHTKQPSAERNTAGHNGP